MEISDPGIREALKQTLIGFSLDPRVLRKNNK